MLGCLLPSPPPPPINKGPAGVIGLSSKRQCSWLGGGAALVRPAALTIKVNPPIVVFVAILHEFSDLHLRDILTRLPEDFDQLFGVQEAIGIPVPGGKVQEVGAELFQIGPLLRGCRSCPRPPYPGASSAHALGWASLPGFFSTSLSQGRGGLHGHGLLWAVPTATGLPSGTLICVASWRPFGTSGLRGLISDAARKPT